MNPEYSLDDFLSDDIASAFEAGAANALEDGKYRWAIKSIETSMGQANGVIWKKIHFKGVNADTGSPLNRDRSLTKSTGEINTVALTMLGEQLAKAGIRKTIKELLANKEPLPVVTMNVYTRVGTDQKARQDWSIEACADQTTTEAPF